VASTTRNPTARFLNEGLGGISRQAGPALSLMAREGHQGLPSRTEGRGRGLKIGQVRRRSERRHRAACSAARRQRAAASQHLKNESAPAVATRVRRGPHRPAVATPAWSCRARSRRVVGPTGERPVAAAVEIICRAPPTDAVFDLGRVARMSSAPRAGSGVPDLTAPRMNSPLPSRPYSAYRRRSACPSAMSARHQGGRAVPGVRTGAAR